MIRTLLIIAGAALVLAVATLGGAAAIGGQDLARHGWAWTFRDDNGDTVLFQRDNGVREPDISRTLAWTGGDRLMLDLPNDVTYVQGPEAGVVVTGPKALADRVVLDGDRLTLTAGPNSERITFGWDGNGPTGWADTDRLQITVTAPSVVEFDVVSSSDLTIRAYDQDAMSLSLTGSGDVTASGRTRTLTLAMTGSGDADLDGLDAVDVRVDVAGSGDAGLTSTGEATVTVSGSGDVDLAGRPTKVTSSSTGSGDIRQE